MTDPLSSSRLPRRSILLLGAAGGAGALVAGAVTAERSASGEPAAEAAKRRALYQPDAKEVQTFYRVNRYPIR